MSPNQPKTPNRVVRVPDDTWHPAQAKAALEGTTVSAVIRAALQVYVKGGVPATDELRERLAKALHEAQCGCPTWVVKDLEDTQYDDMAAALLPLVVAVVAEARTEGAIAALEDFDRRKSFGIENWRVHRDITNIVAALRGVGNQNAEPRWSANRLEEVLREGLPDQNAEPETGPAEWGIAWSADHIDSATSWGADEAGARHRVSKYRDYVLVKRPYGQGDDAWLPADQKGTEQ